MGSRKLWLPGLLLVMVVGAGLRSPAIFHRPFWFDEGDTWSSSAASVGKEYGEFIRWTNHFENAPLGYLLPRISMDLFHSEAEWVMRLPALILGVLCIPVAYWLGRVVHSDALGFFTALVVTFDPTQFDQSQQCRMYTALALFTILAAALTIELLRDPYRGMWRLLGLGVLLGLCLWSTLLGTMAWVSLLLGVLILLGMGLVTGRQHPKAGAVIQGFAMVYVVALLTAQMGVFHTINRYLHGPKRGGENTTLVEIARELVVGAKDMIWPGNSVGLVVFVFVAIGMVLVFRKCKTSAAVMLGLLVGTLVMMVPFRRSHRFMDPRYFTVAQPVLWVGLAMLPVGWARWSLRAAGLVVVLGYVGFQAWQCVHIDRWWQQPDKYLLVPAMIEVRDQIKTGEAVALDPPVTKDLARYYHLPVDPVMDDALHMDYRQRTDPKVPETYRANATWLVIGMVNDMNRLDPKNLRYVRRPIEAIAAHYGVKVDDGEYRSHVGKDRVVVLRISKEGIRWKTFGPLGR